MRMREKIERSSDERGFEGRVAKTEEEPSRAM